MKDSCAKVVAVSTSQNRGEKKKNVDKIELKENYGIIGDAHSKNGDVRQISLLSFDEIEEFIRKGVSVSPGDFAENITTKGIVLHELLLGNRLKIGKNVVLEITKIGKECKKPCSIYNAVGDCIMPRVGVFAKVLTGGFVFPKDEIKILE